MSGKVNVLLDYSSLTEESLIKLKDSYFKSYEELDPIIINEGSLKERKFWVFYCRNYLPKK